MSQGQPRRPQAAAQRENQEPIKYGDVFNVRGELANKPITPQDASIMQTTETEVLGQTQKGGTAAVTRNEQAGLVGHKDVTVSQTLPENKASAFLKLMFQAGV